MTHDVVNARAERGVAGIAQFAHHRLPRGRACPLSRRIPRARRAGSGRAVRLCARLHDQSGADRATSGRWPPRIRGRSGERCRRMPSRSSSIQDERMLSSMCLRLRAQILPKPPPQTSTWPGHVVGLRRAEQVDGASGFFRRAGAAQRNHALAGVDHGSAATPTLISRPSMVTVLLCVAGQRLRQARLDQAEGHRVHVDLEAAPFLAPASWSCPADAGLGRRVVGLARRCRRPAIGRDVDHLAEHLAALGRFSLGGGADHRLGGAQDAERRGQVAVQDGVPLLVGHLLDHVVPGVAGVVDDDVDALVGARRLS